MSADTGRLAAALDALGWRAASDAPAAEVAAALQPHVQAYARHGDRTRLVRGLAAELHRHAHPLDGSRAPVSAWEPLASELVRRVADRPEGAS